MDPNLFYLNWDLLFEVFITIIFLSFVIERALALIFESKLYINTLGGKGLKELLALLLSFGVCFWMEFDAMSILFQRDKTHMLGYALTAAIVAGGSKASIALFKNFWKVMSDAEKMRKQKKEEEVNEGA